MNVLVTSAGRRTTLVDKFRAATEARGGRVIAGDVDGLAPALFRAHAAVRLPRVTTEGYVDRLLEIVDEHRIGCLVPTIDTELLVLAENHERFLARGCRAIGSEPRLIAIARDKWLTASELSAKGIRVPRSWLPEHVAEARARGELPNELFVKPRDGSASAHTYKTALAELDAVLPRVPRAIVQEEVRAPEITIDAFVSFDGTPLHYVPRLRIRTVGGESIQGRTIDDAGPLGPWLAKMLGAFADLGARGPLTIQAFLTEGEPTLSEINPRFGGGFPLAYAAGGTYPEWILGMIAGETIEPRLGVYEKDLWMTRAYFEHFVKAPLW